MYKCTECGTEYEIKPDYCDCGNDSFEEVATKKVAEKIETPKTTPNSIPKINKKTEKPQYSPLDNLKKSFDPISLSVFIICLILSVLTIFFVGNPDENNSTESKKNTSTEQIINIPNIDLFWDNTPIKIVVKEPVIEQKPVITKVEQKIEDIKQIFKPQKQPTTIEKPTPKKITTTQNKVQPTKTTTKTQKQTQTKSTQTSTKQQTTVSSKEVNELTSRIKNNISYTNQNQNHTPKVQPKTQTKNVPSIRTTPNNTQTQTNVVKKQTQAQTAPTKSTQQIKQELSSYKISLQNTIGRKIDFAKVMGDGECAVSFKINSSGSLVNRTFTKQSSNIILNDAVFGAVNSTPTFKAPPEGYKNETLTLRVKFYDGNFSINLE